ncbi:unnamed protein product, partial [Laminaria digitata]
GLSPGSAGGRGGAVAATAPAAGRHHLGRNGRRSRCQPPRGRGRGGWGAVINVVIVVHGAASVRPAKAWGQQQQQRQQQRQQQQQRCEQGAHAARHIDGPPTRPAARRRGRRVRLWGRPAWVPGLGFWGAVEFDRRRRPGVRRSLYHTPLRRVQRWCCWLWLVS